MHRVFNFSAGPATLPETILKTAQAELLNWQDTGMSVLEVSHRSAEFETLMQEADANVRDLLGVPDNYHVLFLHGGGQAQFSAIPLNLLGDKQVVDYIDTGIWSQKAIKEAGKYTEVNTVISAESNGYKSVPARSEWQLSGDKAAYLHITPNETINGLEFPEDLDFSADAPVVADMSSTIFTKPIDVNKYGVIYAGAQKTIGPAGLAIVIIRDDLLGRAHQHTPSILDYTQQAKAKSLLNTAPVATCYFAALMFQWLKAEGGVAEMGKRASAKANALYEFIDNTPFYHNAIQADCRSRTNIPFTLADDKLDKVFLEEAKANGLANLKGHRLVGGMRASIYNAMPMAGVNQLIAFMQDFAKTHG